MYKKKQPDIPRKNFEEVLKLILSPNIVMPPWFPRPRNAYDLIGRLHFPSMGACSTGLVYLHLIRRCPGRSARLPLVFAPWLLFSIK